MSLEDFIKELYILKGQINAYNLVCDHEKLCRLSLSDDNISMIEYDTFCSIMELQQKTAKDKEKCKTEVKQQVQRMLDMLQEAGLKRPDDLYELTQLTRLE